MEVAERKALQDWLVRLSQGDRAAFDPAFQALWPLLSKLCMRALGDAAAGEDAAQAALCDIFANADEIDPERDAVAWAVGVALWQCRTSRRKAERRREDVSAEARERTTALASGGASPEDIAEFNELRGALELALGELRPADADLLRTLLRGERPQIPNTTFRKRLQRATARLREAWRHRHGTD